jgi:hypothetical protein
MLKTMLNTDNTGKTELANQQDEFRARMSTKKTNSIHIALNWHKALQPWAVEIMEEILIERAARKRRIAR